MEKIYMEESRNNKKGVFNYSVVLSFAVAFFAVFSLVAAGFNQISYAVPIESDEFTFNMYKKDQVVYVRGKNADNTSNFRIPVFIANNDSNIPLICIEQSNSVIDGSNYKKSEEITDYGLLYLLNNSIINNKHILPDNLSNFTDTARKYVELWSIQVAVWVYLNESYPGDPLHNFKNEYGSYEGIRNASIFELDGVGINDSEEFSVNFGYSIFDKYIRPLIDQAKGVKSLKQITVTKDDGDIVKTSDGKFYQTTAISVIGDPSSDFESYDINLSGVDGAFAVDENGNNLDLKNVAAGQKFYVRIPVDKVSENVQNLSINITGHFKSLIGNIYSSGNLQKVVTVKGGTVDVGGGLSIEIVGAPDTGMNSAQTIYFIGLVVLLCGVGIIYANAKPVEVKQ